MSPDRASCLTYRNHQIAQAVDDGGCAGVDDHRRIGLLDDCRTGETHSSPEGGTVEDRGVEPLALEAHLPHAARLRRSRPVNGGGKNRQIDRSAPADHGGAQVHEYRCHLRQFDVEPRLVALEKIGQHQPGIKTRRGHRHPEHMALTAKQQIDFMANHDFGERHSILVEKPPSISAVAASASGWPTLWTKSCRTGARTQPRPEVMPGNRGTRTVGMPSSRAISTACKGPAPPKANRAKSRGSCPFSIDTRRIACAS